MRLAQTPLSLPQWIKAFALRQDLLPSESVRSAKALFHRDKLGGVCVIVPVRSKTPHGFSMNRSRFRKENAHFTNLASFENEKPIG